jgi:chorismate synthase
MEQAILRAKNNGDSVGGSIECMATGLPAGLGDPFFDSVESQLSHMMFSVPAVKGIEFGDGFAFAGMRGSQANDSFYYAGNAVKTKTNHNGGINGGITNGMPILFRVAVKPTPSISQVQDTIDTDTEENCKLEIKGRHDPCIVQRAVPVIEAAAAWTLLDVWLATPQGK